MSSTVVKWLMLLTVVCVVQLDCEIYQDKPKIKTSDGDLILIPAEDKNIYLRSNGARSRVFIGNVDMLQESVIQYQPTTNENFNKYFDGLLQRLQVLESNTPATSDLASLNITNLWRRVNKLNRKILALRNQINSRPSRECDSHPCEHGGTCLNLVDGYHCLCPSNWEGRNCDEDVDECRNFAGTDLGCQNGATCVNKPGTYECLCRPSWFGIHCTRKVKDCSAGDFEMCGYGTCIPVTSGEGIKCICHQGWTNNATSTVCLTDINECESHNGPRCSTNPKVECVNTPGSFRCGQCPAGYEGDGYICNDIDECTTIRNGGCSPMVSCHNTIGSRVCGACPPGYQGDGVTCTFRGLCSINHGGCHSSARCRESPSPTGLTVQCVCPEGMDGDGIGSTGCYVSTDNYTRGCHNNPCGIHGWCHPVRSSYICICHKGYGGLHCDTATDSCASNPCQNGGLCRQDSISGFRCECTAQYSGVLCQVRLKSCGGVLDAEEGSIYFPLPNTTNIYKNKVECAWHIHTVADKVLNVTFTRFIVDLTPECSSEFLQLHDGRRASSQLIGRFCGKTLPKDGRNILSSHNYLYLWFHSNEADTKAEFTLHWTSVKPVCGGELNATTHGHISSPGSPGPYPPNRDCYWHLVTTPGKRISLYFFEFDIEVHSNCSFDYLAIYDGERTTDPLLSKYCNSTQPAPVQSASSDILIHFHSDAFGNGNGFQIAYEPIEGIPGCGGLYTADRGEIVSPTYDGKYLSNLLCEYKIRTSAETKIKIVFKIFRLEQSFRCKHDYLKVYDGPSSDSKLVGKFCGTTYPATYTSSSNTLYFKFKSDRSTAGEGFRISYELICEKTLLGDSGIIKSPSYPFSYPKNRVCVYVIGTEPGKAIQSTFQDFDLEDDKLMRRYQSDECRFDYVEIRDGVDINSTLLGRYCGGSEHISPVQISTHNYMYIRFVSDADIAGTGFYANYTTIDTECGGIYRGVSGSINYPPGNNEISYENGRNCQWLIIAPEEKRIKLTWNRFAIEDSHECINDYLELVEINDDNKNDVLGRYCGSRSPPTLTTFTSRLKLKFVSYINETQTPHDGFSLSYIFIDDNNCGGSYTKAHGYIHSPGWPKRYSNSLDCSWRIIVPAGQQIMLNITQFDIEGQSVVTNNCYDFLEIRNGDSISAPLIGKYCGQMKSKRITSLTNVVYLHFHSDSSNNGRGFTIEWDGTITGCGGTLTSSSGSITSPNYPNNYHEDAECFYRVVTSAGSRIHISFTELDLEKSASCRKDYIQIYDGRSTDAPSIGKYCEMTTESLSIDLTTNYGFIKFRSDSSIGGKGFVLNYNTVCNNNITGRYGVIESPDYPNSYSMNLNCLWNIQVPKGNRINVTFTHFDVQRYVLPIWRSRSSYPYRHPWRHDTLGYHDIHYRRRPWMDTNYDYNDYDYDYAGDDSCKEDYLQVKENSESSFSNKMCGSSLPKDISTKSNSLQIKFVTAIYGTSKSGFRLEWVSYGCGGHILKQSGTVSIDKSLTTAKEMECEWLIETTPGKDISITFTHIYMLQTNNCTTDAIEIYNGQNTKAPLISKICHQALDAHVTIESDGNYMLVRLIKQSTLKDVYFTSKFRSSKSKCGGLLKSTSGYFYSKNYPKNYDNDQDCIWYIVVPENHRIEINFIDFDLYSDPDKSINDDEDCGDVVLIYDVPVYSSSSNYTHRICPNSNNTQIVTKYHNVVVQFKSDREGTAKGFKASFSVTCGAVTYAAQDDIITYDKYLSHSNKSCIWTIQTTEPDKKISLTLTHMSLPKDADVITNRHCPSAFLRILDGNDNKAPLIGEYCGRKVPPMIVSRGNAITIELGSYTGGIIGQFSLHYSPILNACGGTLTTEEGSIASPSYPNSYPVGTDCEWVLNTSPGNTAYVTFEQFDLAYSEGCNEDYLELRENDDGGKLLNVYCGSDIPTNYTKAEKIYIKFHSSSLTSGQGFLLHYGYLHDTDIYKEYGEITSPLYPIPYAGAGEYNWRISIAGLDNIVLTVDYLEISSHSEESYNKLIIYDGYDKTAPIIKELRGVIDEKQTFQASSGVVYVSLTMDHTNTGSMFHITWTTSSVNKEASDFIERINCGSNHTELLLPGQEKDLKSPNYPAEYKNDLNCLWKYRTQTGRHLSVKFTYFHLEETQDCYADSVSIYSADLPGNWKFIQKSCESMSVVGEIHASLYMKIKFNTDSSITNKGFAAQVSSRCGGLVTDRSGVVGPTWFDVYATTEPKVKCNWTIRVRPGRTIKLKFNHFNITTLNTDCKTSVVLRNGDSVESPLLASGKYCGYEHEKKTNIETSSNGLYVSYTSESRADRLPYQSFEIYYEEEDYECGLTAKLSPGHEWETINSSNYPDVPIPYSECVWIFTGPPGEILRIDFIDKFDVDATDDCGTEVIEIRDGSSRFSPLKGRYCGQRPGTVKTSSNAVYIKYSTQLSIPRNGFKANVSIDVCGGTIIADFGEVTSPGYPQMQVLPQGTVCEWHIIGPPGRIFLIKPLDVQLPQSKINCTNRIDIEETTPYLQNNTTILKTICGHTVKEDLEAIETLNNTFTVKLTLDRSVEWDQISENRGFRITFNSSQPQCGGSITASEGYLVTPSYPQETTIKHCFWRIKIPNKNRRIHLEIIDSDQTKNSIYLTDFPDMISRLNFSLTYDSLGSALSVFVIAKNAQHRFKAKFTSNEPTLCGGELSGFTQEIVSPNIQRSYTCDWNYNGLLSSDDQTDLTYKTIFITTYMNSSESGSACSGYVPLILISSSNFERKICKGPVVAYRIPFSELRIWAWKPGTQNFYFRLNLKLQPCGGHVDIGPNPVNIINTPNSYNDTLDCAWFVAGDGNPLEFKMEGEFLLQCDDEYLTIYSSAMARFDSLPIGRYCKTNLMDKPLTVNYYGLYIDYHSSVKANNSIKLFAHTVTRSQRCGGLLWYYGSAFTSPNYPKAYRANDECMWEIHAELGYRVSLQFISRFVIEDRPNCTKDVVIIYDWKDDVYEEMGRVCGRQTPPPYNSTFNRLKVVFRTDGEINLDGFKAQWTPICGGKFIATEKEQILYSPGYPKTYDSNMDCLYELSAPSGEKILLKFLDFELEGSSPECRYDNVSMRAETDEYASYAIFCDKIIPAATRKYEKVTLEFKTDDSLERKGFKLAYSIYTCGGKVNDTTVISSSVSDENYDNSMNCTWIIEAPPMKVVVVKFIYIYLEGHTECGLDYVALYDGQNINEDKRLALLCGHVNSTTILTSTQNSMVMEFITDSTRNYKGFKAAIYFSYSEAVGCGGRIDLTSNSSHILKSPLISKAVYENFLDCHWIVTSPSGTVIKIAFTKFDIAPCYNFNQTAIGYTECECDLVEIKDGLHPENLVMGTYCGHVLPPNIITSSNVMSVRLSTDGELVSTGFEATLTVEQSLCGESVILVSSTLRRFKSPGYDNGSVPPGIHCIYHLDSSSQPYTQMRITVVDLQLSSPVNVSTGISRCLKDRLVISSSSSHSNITVGKDLIIHHQYDDFFTHYYLRGSDIHMGDYIELCGHKKLVDYYVYGMTSFNLITSPDTDSGVHKGVEIEVAFVGFCGRNYTEPYGRILSTETEYKHNKSCYTLITAPENFTISAYFLDVTPVFHDNKNYLEIFDGDNPRAELLIKIQNRYNNFPVFSTGRYMLLHNHQDNGDALSYDMNYVITDKGIGCGGKLSNILGAVTSPNFPLTYRRNSICEWVLETPVTTHLMIRFTEFDLGANCEQNYLQLVDSKGAVVRTFCSEPPADYTSDDNYVKLVFYTTKNNAGRGWSAVFVGTVL